MMVLFSGLLYWATLYFLMNNSIRTDKIVRAISSCVFDSRNTTPTPHNVAECILMLNAVPAYVPVCPVTRILGFSEVSVMLWPEIGYE